MRERLPEILPIDDITDIRAVDLRARGIATLVMDIENVLTPYHVYEVRQDAANHIDSLKSAVNGLTVVLATNNNDEPQPGHEMGLATFVAQELKVAVVHPSLGYKKKPHADMLNAARVFSRMPSEPVAFVDDQAKNYLAAVRAKYDLFFWPNPYGHEVHRGVRLVHNWVERPLVRPAVVTAKAAKDIYRSGI